MNEYVTFKKIIDEWDPIGLLKMGCPDDEYAPEVVDIIRLLPRVKSVDELAMGIQKVFTDWFAETLVIEDCNTAAKKIWSHC